MIKNKQKINICDFGVGSNRILPIILTIINSLNLAIYKDEIVGLTPKTFIIEEPESNLHPKLQSKFADFLIDAAYKFNIQFIIETHSEYLIRKLQYWTASKVLKPEDTVIYYFNDPAKIRKDQNQVEVINILNDGSLSSDFGPGFFDEAISWKLELLKIKNAQHN